MSEETIFELLHSAVVDYVVEEDKKQLENTKKTDVKVWR